MGRLFTLPLFFIPLERLGQAREKKKGSVKPCKKIDQDLGFVPLITARNLAGRQKNVNKQGSNTRDQVERFPPPMARYLANTTLLETSWQCFHSIFKS